MSFNVRALKREHTIRFWRRIFAEKPYIGVVQLTGGRMWGRTNRKARIVGDTETTGADARFAVPKLAREAALRTRFVGLAELFRGSPATVVYGDEIGAVVEVLRRAQRLDGGVLVGGRFGDALIGASIWHEVLEGDGAAAEWTRLVRVLRAQTGVVETLDASGRALVRGVERPTERLVRVLASVQGSV